MEVFVNDFQDVTWTNEDFQNKIGFSAGDANGIASILKLEALRAWIDLHVKEKLKETFRNEPSASGYFLGNFSVLERQNEQSIISAGNAVSEDLKQIQTEADQIGAKLILVMVPAPVQVCSSNELGYYPRQVDLQDSARFDPDQPQRIMSGIAEKLDIPLYDLRLALSSEQCLYQPQNMHWLPEGHRAVSDYLTGVLTEKSYIP